MHYLISLDPEGTIALANGDLYSFEIVPDGDYGTANLVIISDTEPTFATIQTAIDMRANAARILAIKAEAQARIYKIVPATKQSNLQAAAVRLILAKLIQIAPVGTFTEAELTGLSGSSVIHDLTIAIRNHSNALEADPNLTPAWPE